MMVVIQDLKHNIINLNNMKNQWLIVRHNEVIPFEVSPIAFDAKGELIIGADSHGLIWTRYDIANFAFSKNLFRFAISAEKINQEELINLIKLIQESI